MSTDDPKEKPVGQQKIDEAVLMQIWLDGAMSGIASAVSTLVPGASGHQADQYAQEMVTALSSTREGRAIVRQQVQERIQGVDTGPREMLVQVRRQPAPVEEEEGGAR